MRKLMFGILMGLAAMTGLAAQPVLAAPSQLCNEITDPELKQQAGCSLTNNDTADKMANGIIKVVLSVVGVVAVVAMIIGGVMYIISSGDASKINRAKNIIMYGLIGLVVSLLAYAIVIFVLDGIG